MSSRFSAPPKSDSAAGAASATAGLAKRFARLFLGASPSADAERIFTEHSHLATPAAVAALEQLSEVELGLLTLDTIISNKSVEYADVYVAMLFYVHKKYDGLLPLPQPPPTNPLRHSAAATGGILSAAILAYPPLIGGDESPHVLNHETGHAKAPSVGRFEIAARHHLRKSGVAQKAGLMQRRQQPPLLGGVFDLVFDACLVVTTVASEDTPGGRVNAEAMCREFSSDPVLRPLITRLFKADLEILRAKDPDYTELEVAHFSDPSRHATQLVADACELAGLKFTILACHDDDTNIVFHPETLKDAAANNCRESKARLWDQMTVRALRPLVVHGLDGTPFDGEGYAEEYVIEHSPHDDERKASLSCRGNVHNKAKAKVEKAKKRRSEADAPDASPSKAAAAEEAEAAAAAAQARADDANVHNKAKAKVEEAKKRRSEADAPDASPSKAAAAEEAEAAAAAAQDRADTTLANKRAAHPSEKAKKAKKEATEAAAAAEAPDASPSKATAAEKAAAAAAAAQDRADTALANLRATVQSSGHRAKHALYYLEKCQRYKSLADPTEIRDLPVGEQAPYGFVSVGAPASRAALLGSVPKKAREAPTKTGSERKPYAKKGEVQALKEKLIARGLPHSATQVEKLQKTLDNYEAKQRLLQQPLLQQPLSSPIKKGRAKKSPAKKSPAKKKATATTTT